MSGSYAPPRPIPVNTNPTVTSTTSTTSFDLLDMQIPSSNTVKTQDPNRTGSTVGSGLSNNLNFELSNMSTSTGTGLSSGITGGSTASAASDLDSFFAQEARLSSGQSQSGSQVVNPFASSSNQIPNLNSGLPGSELQDLTSNMSLSNTQPSNPPPLFSNNPDFQNTTTTTSTSTSVTTTALASQLPDFLKSAKHPIVCLFHLLFKSLCLLIYFFGTTLFYSNSVLTYIFCILLLTFDFWTVKNISGRLLVGLRWWNIEQDTQSQSDGNSNNQELKDGAASFGLSSKPGIKVNHDPYWGWHFESLEDESQLDPIDKNIFWLATYSWALIWSLLFLLHLISFNFSWLVFLLIANTFAWTNLVAFWKCSNDQKNKIQSWAAGKAKDIVFSSDAGRTGLMGYLGNLGGILGGGGGNR